MEDSEWALLHSWVEMISFTEQALPKHIVAGRAEAQETETNKLWSGHCFYYPQQYDLGWASQSFCASVIPDVLAILIMGRNWSCYVSVAHTQCFKPGSWEHLYLQLIFIYFEPLILIFIVYFLLYFFLLIINPPYTLFYPHPCPSPLQSPYCCLCPWVLFFFFSQDQLS